MKTLEKIYYYILANWDILGPIALGIIELILRALPTKKNYSILDFLYRTIARTVPNKRVPDGREKIVEFDKEGNRKNSVPVRTDRHIVMIIIFVLLSVTLFAQNPVTTQSRGLFLYNGFDTTTLKNTRQLLQTNTGNTGGLFFDRWNNKWRVWNPAIAQWVDWNLFNGSGGSFWPVNGNGIITGDVFIYPNNPAAHNVFIGENAGADSVIAKIVVHAQETIMQGDTDVTIESSTGAVTLNSQANNVIIVASNDVNLNAQLGIINSLNRHLFNPTSALAGINIGSVVADPLTLVNGDLFYQSTNNYIGVRISGNTGRMLYTNSSAVRQIPWYNNTSGQMTSSPNLTFTNSNHILSTSVVSPTNNGEFGYNSQFGGYEGMISATAVTFPAVTQSSVLSTRIPFFDVNATGHMATEGNFTYDATNDNLLVDHIGQGLGTVETMTIGTNTGNALQIAPDANLVLVSATGRILLNSIPSIGATIATNNANVQILTRNAGTNNIEVRDASTLITGLTATQVGFGNGSNQLSGDANFNWENVTRVLTMGPLAGVHAQYADEAVELNNGGSSIGGLDYSGTVFRVFGTSSLLNESNGGITIRYDATGTNSDFIIVDATGSMRANCTGAPAGAVYNNGDGILRICP